MEIGSNIILITGGSSGIGLALAERFLLGGDEIAANPLKPAFYSPFDETEKSVYRERHLGPCVRALALAPVYSATKAGFHSFTLSLRHQLSKTSIKVVEIAPPAVNTDLGGPGLHNEATPLNEFADGAFAGLKGGRDLVTYGFSEKSAHASREELDEIFKRMNRQG